VTSVNVPFRLVFVQPVAGARRGAAQAGSREHEDIQPAVVVVIQKCDPGAHDFDDVVHTVGPPADGWRAQARLRRHIGESGVKRLSGRLAARRRLHTARGHPALRLERRRTQECEPFPPGHALL
jgi:hypothetical protein